MSSTRFGHQHAQHLRSAHFALFLLCVILGIASSSTVESRAVEDIASITQSVNRFDSTFLQNGIRQSLERLKLKHREHTTSAAFITPFGVPLALITSQCWGLLTDEPNRVVDASWVAHPQSTRDRDSEPRAHWDGVERIVVPRPRTLTEFAALWDTLQNLRVAENAADILPGEWRIKDNAAGDQPLSRTNAMPKSSCGLTLTPAEGGAVRFEGVDCWYTGKVGEDHRLFHSPWKESSAQFFAWPVELKGQDLYRVAHTVDWPAGPFSFVFPVLNELPQALKELELNVLWHVLYREAIAPVGAFELFGTKVPEKFLLFWGLPLILVIQLYFWVHLRAALHAGLRVQTNESWPWIGLYPDSLSRLITALSLCVLPLVVASALVYRHVSAIGARSPEGASAVILTALVAGVAHQTFISIKGLRETLPVKGIRFE